MRMILVLAGLLAAAPLGTQAPASAPKPAHGDTSPVDYAQPANWICRPGVDDGTCSTHLDAVRIDAAGNRTPAPHVAAKGPPIDCFYVYPTASLDPTLYSDLVPDAEERRSVHGQAARLDARCRLFVPTYHQLTIAALRWSLGPDGEAPSFDEPYRDVLAAWRSYLTHDNRGRGVVLIGHSQGALLLKRLIAEEIDGKPVQRRLVAAYLAGNLDVSTASFRTVKPCARGDQTGCVVAWSSYVEGDQGPRFFGNSVPPGSAICVNPAAISGGRGTLDAYLSKPPLSPAEDPPYLELAGAMTAECVADAAGAVLRIRIEPGPAAELLKVVMQRYSGIPTWGVHQLDISLVQGNMVALIGSQSAAWMALTSRNAAGPGGGWSGRVRVRLSARADGCAATHPPLRNRC